MLNATTERRRFFRINDTVSMSYRQIDEATANLGLKSTGIIGSEFSLAATLDVLSQEAMRIMQRMEKQSPEILELYRILDAKVNAVAQATMFVGSHVNAQNCQDVNLSASGLAFEQVEPLTIGQNLAIEIYLPSSLALMRIYGRVISCRSNDNAGEEPVNYTVSVDFTHVNEEDQELLIKHVVRMQWQQLRDSKAQSEI
ncbi:MAG: PilZ domain-containing protein [Methylomonas sp.]|jgi:c-di-GMP-binding flagellar brake protein YcgR|uniref:PilZ domain-containing protein n=1 Tax=Methylomonas sp. TaxID=418 RepID=UPI0025EB3C2D|nr:PilZ domain-containing protein [Methylomonas sp.]MCK9607246.1 PilZ domain-containing protein [Methylomonas sp.]